MGCGPPGKGPVLGAAPFRREEAARGPGLRAPKWRPARAHAEGRRPAYPSASLGGSSPLESAIGWPPSPGRQLRPSQATGPSPRPRLRLELTFEVAFPFLSLKRRRRGHLPTAGVAEVPGTAPGTRPLRPQPGAIHRAGAPGRREARLGARRGAGSEEAHPGLLGKVPEPGWRRLFPRRPLLGTRPAGEEASGHWRRGEAALKSLPARPHSARPCCSYTF